MEEVKTWITTRKELGANTRYSVIQSKEGYYLVDHARAWWGYLLPIFNWLIPARVLKINLSNKQVNDLLLDKKLSEKLDEEGNKGAGAAILIGALTAPSVVPLLGVLDIHTSIYIYILSAFLVMALIVIFQIILFKKAKRILDVIGKNNLTEARMIIVPASIMQGIKELLLFITCISLAILFKFFFLLTEDNHGNLFMSILGTVMFFCYLNINIAIVAIGRYKIKLKKWESKK